MMPLIIAVLLGLSAAVLVVYPLLAPEAPRRADATPAALLDASERERSAKQALRDVDFDYRLGNLEASDYAALREKYERRALLALKARVERERAADALIDQQLARLRAQQAKKRAPLGDSIGTAHTPSTGAAHVSVRAGSNGSNGSRPTGRGPGARRRKGA